MGESTRGSIHAGVANFVIPFARIDFKQDLNAEEIKKTLEPTRIWTAGVYAEAAPGYVGVGINVGSDLERGIDKQADHIETALAMQLKNLDKNMSLPLLKDQMKKSFPQ